MPRIALAPGTGGPAGALPSRPEIQVNAGRQGPIPQNRLPLGAVAVKPSFAAVPQIEHNWTTRRPAPPSNLNGVGATKISRAFDDDRNDRDER